MDALLVVLGHFPFHVVSVETFSSGASTRPIRKTRRRCGPFCRAHFQHFLGRSVLRWAAVPDPRMLLRLEGLQRLDGDRGQLPGLIRCEVLSVRSEVLSVVMRRLRHTTRKVRYSE